MTCYLYAIGRIEGPVKVGVSSFPRGRISTLQTGCPFPLRILHALKCDNREQAFEYESLFHGVFAKARLIGEWFNMDAQAVYTELNALVEDVEAYKAELRA